MRQFENPAVSAFAAAIGTEHVFGQVLIRRAGAGWELRNLADREARPQDLSERFVESLRELAQFDGHRNFRPLKSAPDLVGGWRCMAANDTALGESLEHIYPGALADWFAARAPQPPVTGYREFTGRQSGMYRITTTLSDAQAALTIRAGCHRQFCLKRRLWSVPGLATDSVAEKSEIPCLEPCAILLEFARKEARGEQEQKVAVSLSPSEATELRNLIEGAVTPNGTNGTSAPSADQRRRWRLIAEKLAGTPPLSLPSITS